MSKREARGHYLRDGRFVNPEGTTIPVPQPEGSSCLARAIWMLGPALLDAYLWYQATSEGNPELLGIAFVGVPIAAIIGIAAATWR